MSDAIRLDVKVNYKDKFDLETTDELSYSEAQNIVINYGNKEVHILLSRSGEILVRIV